MKTITREDFKTCLQIVLQYEEQIKKDLKEIQKTKIISNPTFLYLVNNEEVCVRTYNCLKAIFGTGGETKIAELNGFDVYKLILCRGFGNGSMKEIEFVCKKYKITLSSSQSLRHTRGINLHEFKDIIDV